MGGYQTTTVGLSNDQVVLTVEPRRKRSCGLVDLLFVGIRELLHQSVDNDINRQL